MEFGILGPLEVTSASGPVRVDAPKQRALLAVLILHANEVVSTDRLLDLVWGDEDAAGGVSKLRFQISKLRDALEPERDGDESAVVLTRSPGYTLIAGPAAVDAVRFEGMVRGAREILRSNLDEALNRLDEALALWRGPVLGEFEYEEWAQPEIRRLNELRLGAIEDRCDALVALGRDRDAIGDLEALVAEHPRRERLRGTLMLALYRSGRQADALAVYQELRRELGEGLGIDPSIEIQNLEERILLQDPSLQKEGAVSADRLRGFVVSGQLGEGAHGVVHRAAQSGVGREVAIKTIRPELANDPGFVRRFEAEAQVVASLAHPHIVPLFDFWRDPDGAYLVMPCLQGGNLAALFDGGPLEPENVSRLVGRLGDALAYAHRRGVVHRDVTPENVLLDEEGNPYLADFGVASLLGDSAVASASSPGYLPPEVHAGGAATPASDVFSLGVLAHTMLTGHVPGMNEPLPPVSSLRPEVSAGVDGVIARATATGIADRYDDVEAFVAEFDAALGEVTAVAAEERIEVRNPYKGLQAFQETDASDFFGRSSLAAELAAKLESHRLVGVVGPSGCGKSSLVRAGLIPRVRAGAIGGSDRWLVTDMYPGSRPFSELEAALLQVAVARPGSLIESLTRGGEGWETVVDELLPAGAEVLLIIDQFEELFTLTVDTAVRRRFLETIAHLVSDPDSRIRVVLTMRADFYDRPLEYAAFGTLLRSGLVSLTMPDGESLVEAVVGPAEGVGLALDPGTAETVVADVANQPGGLPLLEYALTEMFARRAGSVLTVDDYHRTGGVFGALGLRAEDLYSEYDEAGRAATRQVFLRLVAVEEGAADTRRRIPSAEVSALGIDPEALERILHDYGSHRLLTFDRDPNTRAPTIEVAHEALLTRWERLRIWIDELRDDLVLHRHLATAVAEWEANGRADAYLLPFGRLDHYEVFATETDLALTDVERDYLVRSRTHVDAQRSSRRRRRQMILAGFAAAAVIAIVLAVTALANQQRAEDATEVAQEQADRADQSAVEASASAEEATKNAALAETNADEAAVNAEEAATNAEIARAQELAAKAKLTLDEDAELGILLALEAVKIDSGDGPLKEAQEALHQAVVASRVRLEVPGDTRVGIDRAGERIVSRDREGPVTIYDARTGAVETVLPFPGSFEEFHVDFVMAISPDGKLVATGRTDGTVTIWNADTGEELATTNDRQEFWTDAEAGTFTFSYGYGDVMTEPIPFNATAAQIEAALEALPEVADVTVDGIGTQVDPWFVTPVSLETPYTDRFTPNVDELEPESARVAMAGRGHDDPNENDIGVDGISAVQFSPDSTMLASWGWDETIRMWNVANLSQTLEIEASALPFRAVGMDFSHDGSMLAAPAPPGIPIWDTKTGEEIKRLGEGGYAATDVAFFPAGDRLAVANGYPDWALSVWDIETETEHLVPGGGNWLRVVAVSPDGTLIATGDDGGVVTVSESTEMGERSLYSFSAHNGRTMDVVFAGTGNMLATVSDAEARLWDLGLSGSREWLTLQGSAYGGGAVAYSPDGTVLVHSTNDPGVQAEFDFASRVAVVDADSGELLHMLDTGGESVLEIAISPSGTQVAIAGRIDIGFAESPAVQMWDLSTGEFVGVPNGAEYPAGATSVQYSPDGTLLAAVVDGEVRFWDAASLDPIRTLTSDDPEADLREIAFSPDGEQLAVRGTMFGSDFVDVYNVPTGELVTTCCEHIWWLWAASVEYSPDGRYLVTSGIDPETEEGTVVVWDATTGDMVATLSGHPEAVFDAVFSPDGSLIASGGADMRIWDADTWTELVTLEQPGGNVGAIFDVAFSPDGKRVVSITDTEGDVRVWAVEFKDLIGIAQSRLTRTFTAAECEIYAIDPCPAEE